jgi:hypothetical protein
LEKVVVAAAILSQKLRIGDAKIGVEGARSKYDFRAVGKRVGRRKKLDEEERCENEEETTSE